MDAIQKIFTGHHIDLDKILLISDAYFIDYDVLYVGFDITFQLKDDVYHYERELENIIEKEYIPPIEKQWYGITKEICDDNGEILAVKNLQKQIDKVIKMWKQRKAECEKLNT